jgi:hypothetical protein
MPAAGKRRSGEKQLSPKAFQPKEDVPKSIFSQNDPPDIVIIPGIILYLVDLIISADTFETPSCFNRKSLMRQFPVSIESR